VKKFQYIRTELSSSKYEVQAPIPWLLAAVVAVTCVFVGVTIVSLKKFAFTFVRREAKKN
jgi:hypothetical protein